MPGRLDLTGRRFGRLVVVSVASSIKGCTRWLCRCDCGRVEIVRTNRLRTSVEPRRAVTECKKCRSAACVICAKPFSAKNNKKTCSPECKRVLERRSAEQWAERNREKVLAAQRKHYRANADRILAARKIRKASMTPDELRELYAKSRAHTRAYALRNPRSANPEKHRKYLLKLREYRRRRALAKLVAVGKELEKRSDT